MNDPYSVLGLPHDATEADAKRQFRKLAMQHHPDRNAGDAGAEARFKEIAGAWEAVEKGWRPGQPLPGQEQPGFRGPPGGMPGGFSSGPFEFTFNAGHGANPFEDFMATMHTQRQRRNRDYNVVCQISLADAFAGVDVAIPVRSPAETRTITVRLPAGVDSGSRIRVPQAGEKMHGELAPGDLYVTVQVMPHDRFERVQADLIVVVDLDVLDILLGTSVPVTGIDGRTMEVKVPAGFDPSSRMRLPGQGMPTTNSARRGDLMVALRPCYPALNPRQLEMLERARALANPPGGAPD